MFSLQNIDPLRDFCEKTNKQTNKRELIPTKITMRQYEDDENVCVSHILHDMIAVKREHLGFHELLSREEHTWRLYLATLGLQTFVFMVLLRMFT